MVYLSRIYTKSGDQGETSLGDGTRVPKGHVRIAAYGGVDELNSVLGVAVSLGNLPEKVSGWIRVIQNDLFDVGADLCIPESAPAQGYTPLRVQQPQVDRLERWIDELNLDLAPLNSFILPGGSPAASLLHQARTVCRRCEIGVSQLMQAESLTTPVLPYLNRLSDLLFVAARWCNGKGADDILWKPGAGAQ
ncbi:cob(I)yrinic acid a,c-diamide adenosyltransferase [Planctomyces sp. SH-PL14]|uniref:cob(I)yrinic acid a,c-diamide adenosyltransferase n=1 Tax=Planctomyces sp. SH-PL14 TaxID=1632864 RepID=UPI00078C93B4|nr:cob(I)yrinic acid a,c-diamide adenosyltransferase [Planctomyces sp. SH-PL14]AMV21857.1 Cob(I)yrinic acid a,c-diamide adenosyltransferase [Planctomyces sp. SH-PL14]